MFQKIMTVQSARLRAVFAYSRAWPVAAELQAGRRAGFLAIFLAAALLTGTVRAQSPVMVGLDADMSSSSAQAGEAIRRGALLAIEEINASGGVLGRPLELVVRDHRGNPARGLDNMLEFADMPGLLAVIGGLHTPVAL